MNLHLVRNEIDIDARVLKESKAAAESGVAGPVEMCGLHRSTETEKRPLDGRIIHHIGLRSRGLPGDLLSQSFKYLEWYRRVVGHYRNAPLRVIHCHDLAPLPIAVRLKKLTGARLIYDAHELESERQGLAGFRQWITRRVERRLIRHVDAMITVSPSIREWYRREFPGTGVTLVRNIPEAPLSGVAPVPLRAELGVPSDALLFVYLGGFAKGRGIENAIRAFADPRVPHHVLFMGSGPLQMAIDSAVGVCPRIHRRPPVARDQVIAVTAGADAGISLIEDSCLSYRYCLPNKLFECLLAGIPVLVSALPDQADLIESRRAGWVVDNEVGALVDRLATLGPEDVHGLKAGLTGRVTDLRWSHEAGRMLDLYRSLTLAARSSTSPRSTRARILESGSRRPRHLPAGPMQKSITSSRTASVTSPRRPTAYG